MGQVVDSNEAMRCKYISTILHLAVTLQVNIIGEENTGCVDHMIKNNHIVYNRGQIESSDYALSK